MFVAETPTLRKEINLIRGTAGPKRARLLNLARTLPSRSIYSVGRRGTHCCPFAMTHSDSTSHCFQQDPAEAWIPLTQSQGKAKASQSDILLSQSTSHAHFDHLVPQDGGRRKLLCWQSQSLSQPSQQSKSTSQVSPFCSCHAFVILPPDSAGSSQESSQASAANSRRNAQLNHHIWSVNVVRYKCHFLLKIPRTNPRKNPRKNPENP